MARKRPPDDLPADEPHDSALEASEDVEEDLEPGPEGELGRAARTPADEDDEAPADAQPRLMRRSPPVGDDDADDRRP